MLNAGDANVARRCRIRIASTAGTALSSASEPRSAILPRGRAAVAARRRRASASSPRAGTDCWDVFENRQYSCRQVIR